MSSEMQQGRPALGFDELKHGWGWFLGLGIAVIVLGVIALGTAALVTIISVELFGWLLLIGGILSAAHAFWRRRWEGFFIELFAGILYIVVGLMVVENPAQGAVALTLLIALFLMIGGVLRMVAALTIRFPHSGWVVLNGITSFVLGVIIWRQWPVSGLWVIGLFIGIDMIFYGWSLVMLGLLLKGLPDKRAM